MKMSCKSWRRNSIKAKKKLDKFKVSYIYSKRLLQLKDSMKQPQQQTPNLHLSFQNEVQLSHLQMRYNTIQIYNTVVYLPTYHVMS